MHTKIKTYVLALGLAVVGFTVFPNKVFAHQDSTAATLAVSRTTNTMPVNTKMQYPFSNGETWCVYRGYNYGTHINYGGYDNGQYAIDWVKKSTTSNSFDQTATSTAAVRTIMSGTVQFVVAADNRGNSSYGNRVVILSNYNNKDVYVVYDHLNDISKNKYNRTIAAGDTFNSGDQIASGVYPAGNVYHSHVHVQEVSTGNAVTFTDYGMPTGGGPATSSNGEYGHDSSLTPTTCRTASGITPPVSPAETANITLPDKPNHIKPVYRFYNKVKNYNIWTSDTTEKNALAADTDWLLEGLAFYSETASSNLSNKIPIYRYHHTEKGYILASEAQAPTQPGWILEGVAFYARASRSSGSNRPRVAIYRLEDPVTGRNVYTPASPESINLENAGWQRTVAFHVESTDLCHLRICAVMQMWNSEKKYHTFSSNLTRDLMPKLLNEPGWEMQLGFYGFATTYPTGLKYLHIQYNPVLLSSYVSEIQDELNGNWQDSDRLTVAYWKNNTTEGVPLYEYKNIFTGKYYYGLQESIEGWTKTGKVFRVPPQYERGLYR